jgi:hypothetical protein
MVEAITAQAVTARKPRTRYTIGREAALLPLLAILPDRMLDRILAAALRPYFPRESKGNGFCARALPRKSESQ